MKNQFIKNKLNNQPKKVVKKKMSKSQVITFILMIFWTISSLVSWFTLFRNSAASSGSNVLTAYADTVEESASTYDNTVNNRVKVDFSDTRYQNIIYLGLNENYNNPRADLSFNADGSFRFSCQDNVLLGYKPILTTDSSSLNQEFTEIFFENIEYRTTSSGSPVPLYFYMSLENYITPNYSPLFGLNFISTGGEYFMSPLQSGIAYNISNYVSEDILQNLVRIDLEIYLPETATLDIFCLPVMYFGTTATAVRSYSPMYYLASGMDFGYQDGYDNGLEQGYQNGYEDGLESGTGIFANLNYDIGLYYTNGTYFYLENMNSEIPLSIVDNTITFPVFDTGVVQQDGINKIVLKLKFNNNYSFDDYSFFLKYYDYIISTNNVSAAIYSNGSLIDLTLSDTSLKYGLGRILREPNSGTYPFDSIEFTLLGSQLKNLNDFSLTIYSVDFAKNFVSAYNNGFNTGVKKENFNFKALVGALFDVPVNTLNSLLNFNIPVLDINMYDLCTSLITLGIIIFILRLIL